MDLTEYALFCFGTLFVIVDPVAAVPAFIAMTASHSIPDRVRTARLACLVTSGLLGLFAFIGQPLFRTLGVSLPALQVAGGLLLLLVGGFGAGAVGGLLLAPWMVASYVVLVVVFVLMSAIAGMYYHPLRASLDGTDALPRLDDDALAARLQTRRPEVLATIGVTGLLALIVLMTVKPALW